MSDEKQNPKYDKIVIAWRYEESRQTKSYQQSNVKYWEKEISLIGIHGNKRTVMDHVHLRQVLLCNSVYIIKGWDITKLWLQLQSFEK